ncbi:crossover junction endonuclease MUS81 [Hypoxylon trugodes]|uniref:crossover junction endonuclease MUS81 n=1 Tax=Hypoxylon trugodes TaxID=326681 RepID=UPI0021A163AB|nr:crossover junction endonuclease MUS81 [Hypoxylon trugodes]KAI1383246.1 crossover junction endonuclease MUS81 [Hypoxylon trugodes]
MPSDETCANPLLLGWVQEWVDLARERNSKGLTTYRKAYAALKACPVTFQHPSQLQQLKGFGPKLCDRLTDKMQKHCQENGLPMSKRPRRSTVPGLADQGEDEEGEARPPKRQRKAKPYVPALRSGPYAIIIGLATLEEGTNNGLSKAQLIEVAQPHCDASFTAPPDPRSFYTAWNSMKTLLDKDLVYERRGPTRRYHLTEEGWEVARRIQQTTNPNQPIAVPPRLNPAPEPQEVDLTPPTLSARAPSLEIEDQPNESSYVDVVTNGNSSSSSSSLPNFRPIRLGPGTFEVHLVLDVREVRAKTDRDYMQNELAKKGVNPIMRSLELGDAIWVAKCKEANFLSRLGAEGDEVVLDYIVERKRLDDLISSVKDGRFHEQKFRLKRSGVKNVVYIIEEISMDAETLDKRAEMVQSAIGSTQVVNGFFVKKTQKMDDTIRYLTRMTMLLKKQYESKPLLVIPTEVLTTQNYLPLLEHLRKKEPTTGHHITYPAFASLASKSDMMTLRDLYLKMLMCTRQVTGEKALEIQRRWKTPYDFVKAYEGCGDGDAGKKRKREMVSDQMGNLFGRKKIAKPLSQKIAEIWTNT